MVVHGESNTYLRVPVSQRGPPVAGSLGSSLQAQARALWRAVSQRSILLPAAFVFLWQVWGPIAGFACVFLAAMPSCTLGF